MSNTKTKKDWRDAKEGEIVGEGIAVHASGFEEYYLYIIKNGKRVRIPASQYKTMKPEEQKPIPPKIEHIDTSSRLMEDKPVRPHFLTSKFNLETEHNRRKTLRHTWELLLFLAFVAVLVFILFHHK